MKKSYTGKEGHPPGLVNFSEGLYEKKTLIDPFAGAWSSLMLWLSTAELDHA